jgi:hypothetical protein
MANGVFFAAYPGELTPDDRIALDRPGFKVYEDGIEASAVFSGGEAPSDWTTYQVVRLRAGSVESAREQVVSALGRVPDDLRIYPAQAHI